jgi:hypothetical protein
MIPTHIHAAVDWAAVVGVEMMGHCAPFRSRAQRLVKSSARLHAVYAGVTDYELGEGMLPMPVHLALDTAVGAGLTLRDEPPPVRALLVGMGLTELLLVSRTEREPLSRHEQRA